MNLFSKIFNQKNRNAMEAANLNERNNNGSTALVDENVFVNNTPPNGENKTEKLRGLQKFLDIDFHNQGYQDGYNWHSKDMYENKIEQIKAQFRHQLDLKVDEVRQEILSLENQKSELTGIVESMVIKINNLLAEKRYTLQKIKTEKELSAENEGLVMTCVHNYKEGYLKGANAYMEEELIASNKGLFN